MSSLQLLLLPLLSLTYDTINATNAMERYYYCYYYCCYYFIMFLLIVKIIIIIIYIYIIVIIAIIVTTITNSIIETRKGKHDYAKWKTTNGDKLFRFVFRRSNRDERKCQISCVNSLSEKGHFKEFVIALKEKKKTDIVPNIRRSEKKRTMSRIWKNAPLRCSEYFALVLN